MKYFFRFLIIFFLFSCGDNGERCPGDMLLPIIVSPYKLYYNKGDTISISSKFHKLIYDEKTDKFYNASTYSFLPTISFYTLDNKEMNLQGSQLIQYCNFIKQDSSKMRLGNSNIDSYVIGEYTLENDTLLFEVKLQLTRKGFFWLSFESLTSGDSHLQNNYIFNCRGRAIIFELIPIEENNISLLQKFRKIEPNDYYLADSINRFYNHAGYCFEVR